MTHREEKPHPKPTETQRWLSYWKGCLSDSIKADIDVDKLEHFETEHFDMDAIALKDIDKLNALFEAEETKLNAQKGVYKKSSPGWKSLTELTIAIAPFKIKPRPENLVFLKDRKPKFPFWYFACINRAGMLSVPAETFPVFLRRHLEPLADERTEFIFGSVDDVDKAAALGKEEYDTYPAYVKYLKEVFESATHQPLGAYTAAGYETISNAVALVPDEGIDAAKSIVELYKKVLDEKEVPPLLSALATLERVKADAPPGAAALIDVHHRHIGQMGYGFPLSISQRISLYTLLSTEDKVFAVNGPPGTGKTTLLQSIVANKMVESALKGTHPPLILACSTNNQAVTNIIDSFSRSETKKGTLEGRWLPDIDGYATYLPGNQKTNEELKNINYKKQSGEGLFNRIENRDYVSKAKPYFLQKCTVHIQKAPLHLQDATQKLQQEIQHIQSQLTASSSAWNQYVKTEDSFVTGYAPQLKNQNRETYYSAQLLHEEPFLKDIDLLKSAEKEVVAYFRNEPLFRKLYCFLRIKSALNNRMMELRIILREAPLDPGEENLTSQPGLMQTINAQIELARQMAAGIKHWHTWKAQNGIRGNPPRTMEAYVKQERIKIDDGAGPNCFYDELDVSLRHQAFQLALHYWEGKYLQRLEEDLADPNFDKKGLLPMQNRWHRHAMLTPCFVSTFYMAPKFFVAYKFLMKTNDGKNIFDVLPLFDFIDLLIVDEAGQVSPEVGVATFALAKKAVVVGDVKQIEPVWNVTPKIDIGNLKKCGLIRDYDDPLYEKQFDPKGFLSSTGSIMKLAQNASGFKEKGISEKGVLLREHRRCWDEIIQYCNELAYDGQLIPLKGKAKEDLLFPPMFCIHAEGNSVAQNGSRFNQEEAAVLVTWLIKNRDIIQKKYGSIEKAVGIVTPFAGQKNYLRSALKKAGFDTNVLTVGTVHALQGAERSIVLFSTVYGPGDAGGMFFDRDNKPNMLNVAVSRAKDNFIVFANTRIFNKSARTPSGILSKHLVYEDQTGRRT